MVGSYTDTLLNVNQSLKNPNILSGLKLKILPLRWGFFFDPFFPQLSNAQRLPGVGEGGSSDKCIRAWWCVIGLNRPGSMFKSGAEIFSFSFCLVFFFCFYFF